MAMPDLGRIRQVGVREVWLNEASDFTVWLVEPENLNLLGNALEIELEFVKREAPVGRFRLDILAKNTADDEKVAIENQLEQGNHSHLGQLITYATKHEAGYVVWIALKFQPEHRAAIEWLNQLAPDRVWFYAVEVHAIKIGDSLPAPDFRVVASPKGWSGGWSADAEKVQQEPPLETEEYLQFFQPLLDGLKQIGFGTAEPDQDNSQWWFTHGDDNIWYVIGLDEAAWVCIWVIGSVRRSNQIYGALIEQQDTIAAELGAKPDWENDGRTAEAAVTLYMEGPRSIDEPPEKQDEIRAWMLETLPKFREVFNPRLKRILAELETE